MIKRNHLQSTYNEIKESFFELLDLLNIQIDCSYILEELDEMKYKIQEINITNDPITKEIGDVYTKIYRKYQNKLASPLSPKERKKLTEQIKNWLQVLPVLF